MLQTLWALLLATAPGPEADLATLVARLGSPRYAEREAAAGTLEKLGERAVPALRAARLDRDPEVKNRAEVLLDAIERELLTRPTIVNLDGRALRRIDALRAIAEHEGFQLVVSPPGETGWAMEPLGPREPERVTFWQSLDRLGALGRWEPEVDAPRVGASRQPVMRISPVGKARPRVADFGPFRLYVREPGFAQAVPEFEGLRVRREPLFAPRREAKAPAELMVPIDVMAEPRLALRSGGAVKLLEAVDDLGQSLIPEEAEPGPTDLAWSSGERAMPILSTQIRLKPGPRTAHKIEKLRGVIPVEVEARKLEPVVMSLAQAQGKPFWCGDFTLIVNGLVDQPFRRTKYLDLTVRPSNWVGMPMRWGRGRRFMDTRNTDFDRAWRYIEFADAQGRVARGWTPTPVGFDPDGIRVMVELALDEGVGPPDQIRYYGIARAPTQIPFTLTDLPMP